MVCGKWPIQLPDQGSVFHHFHDCSKLTWTAESSPELNLVSFETLFPSLLPSQQLFFTTFFLSNLKMKINNFVFAIVVGVAYFHVVKTVGQSFTNCPIFLSQFSWSVWYDVVYPLTSFHKHSQSHTFSLSQSHTRVYTLTHTYTYIHTRTLSLSHTQTHTCTHTQTCRHTFTHTHLLSYLHTHTRAHTCEHTHTHTHACTHSFTHTHTRSWAHFPSEYFRVKMRSRFPLIFPPSSSIISFALLLPPFPSFRTEMFCAINWDKTK